MRIFTQSRSHKRLNESQSSSTKSTQQTSSPKQRQCQKCGTTIQALIIQPRQHPHTTSSQPNSKAKKTQRAKLKKTLLRRNYSMKNNITKPLLNSTSKSKSMTLSCTLLRKKLISIRECLVKEVRRIRQRLEGK